MSFRYKLILFSTLFSVLLAFVLPISISTELATYDARLRQVRAIRGNHTPSKASQLLGLTETTRTKIPDWGINEERETYRQVEEIAGSLWVDPHLGWSFVPEEVRAERLPFQPDSDGYVRRVELANETSISPALRLYAGLQGVPLESIEVGDSTVKVGRETLPRLLPVDFPSNDNNHLEPPSLHILFDDQGGAQKSSRELTLARLSGNAVLLVNHTQEARSRTNTPIGDLEGHQITYSTLDTLLSGWRLHDTPLALSIVIAILLCAAHCWWAVRSGSFPVTILSWAVFSGLYWLLAVRLFALGYSIPVVPVIGSSLIAVGIVAIFLQLRAFQLMKQFVGEGRAGDAARGELDLGGQERTVTILFTNLPKAIQALEQVDPEESIRARNRYGKTLTRGVRHNQGRVLDYQGDFQMAGFCVEKVDPNHAVNAVKAGLELCRTLKEQYPDEKIHCGVCTGPAAVGYVGAPSSKELAAIGDTTNVAARLLGAAMKQDVPVLIAATTYELCSGQVVAEKLPAVSLKGKTNVVEVFSVEAVRE